MVSSFTTYTNDISKNEVNALSYPAAFPSQQQESYLNADQQEYFKKKLLEWRSQLLETSSQTVNQMQDCSTKESDDLDIASNLASQTIELRVRGRERKLINKINEALHRIDQGEYGYCEESGEPIGFKRLEARPIATLSIEAQERRERLEKQQAA